MRRLSGTKFAERKVLSQYYILWQKGEPNRAKFLWGLEKTGEGPDEKILRARLKKQCTELEFL